MCFNWNMQLHFLHQLKLTTDVESHFVTLVGAATIVISDAHHCFFKKKK